MVANKYKKIEKLIHIYTNSSRRKRGIRHLEFNTGLRFLSRRHSSIMAKRGRIWHGKNVFLAPDHVSDPLMKFIKFILYPLTLFFPLLWIIINFGDRGASGENVAIMPKGIVRGIGKIDTDKQIALAFHRVWMNSQGHRKNTLNPNFSKIGVGIKRRGNRFYATQLFYG